MEPLMKLKKLLKTIEVKEIKGSKEVEISGLCSDSRLVAPGNLFIAKKGVERDGSLYVPDAIAAGASAVLTDIFNPFIPKEIVQIIDSDISRVEGEMAAEFFAHPSKHLFVIGITGTSGKTTTSYLVKHLFDHLGQEAGLIGTVEWIVKNQYFPSTLTTPDVITNNKLLYEMCQAGCKSAVMEVSSHAIDQKRICGIEFDVAIFTNLSQDHLDYHKDMEEYASVKAKLFQGLSEDQHAVINVDSKWHRVMTQGCKASILTYGIDIKADLMAKKLHLTPSGVEFTVEYLGKVSTLRSPLIGKFNVYNLLAAIGAGLCKGFSLEKVTKALESFSQVSGRLERVSNHKKLNIFVDYAHKPDALEKVLETLREFKQGKLICLFGCGGNRDSGKRPKMGAIAEKLADEVIVTSDNPRNEDPLAIIEQILRGIEKPSHVLVEPDRRLAIQKAIGKMKEHDILLIAGKGHETYQILLNQKIHFDDREVAKEFCG